MAAWRGHSVSHCHLVPKLGCDASEKGKEMFLIQEFCAAAEATHKRYVEDLKSFQDDIICPLVDEDEEEPQLQKGLDLDLELHVSQRALPIVSLGKGFTRYVNKLDALLHAFHLELGSAEQLHKYNSRVISFCTDQGTEFQIATSPAVDVSEILQETAACLEAGGNSLEQLEAGPSAPMLQEGVSVSAVSILPPRFEEGEAAGGGGDAEAEVEVEAVPSEPEQRDRLYPNAFQTADLKHIVDNALHEVLETMKTLPLGFAAKWGHKRGSWVTARVSPCACDVRACTCGER